MGGRLKGRTALVTGAGSGIGEGIARRCAEEGAHVVVAELDEASGGSVAESIGGLFVSCDVTERDQVEAAVDAAISTYGSVDIVVNNAWGGAPYSRVEKKTDEELRRAMEMSFHGPFWAMRAALPAMKENAWGRVINVCSLNGVNAHMGTLGYNVAKEALRTLTRTAAREWAPTGITVNALCPAAKSKAFANAVKKDPTIGATAGAANPMGRIGDAYSDIAPVAVFLASEDSRYLTGNTLFVDGGSHISGVVWVPDLD